jgi:hypothetical protein
MSDRKPELRTEFRYSNGLDALNPVKLLITYSSRFVSRRMLDLGRRGEFLSLPGIKL